jgi:hypothetical protein
MSWEAVKQSVYFIEGSVKGDEISLSTLEYRPKELRCEYKGKICLRWLHQVPNSWQLWSRGVCCISSQVTFPFPKET